MQPALAASAFAGFYDELLAYFSLFCAPRDLLALGQTNSGAYSALSLGGGPCRLT
jgi:hypothetical protein